MQQCAKLSPYFNILNRDIYAFYDTMDFLYCPFPYAIEIPNMEEEMNCGIKKRRTGFETPCPGMQCLSLSRDWGRGEGAKGSSQNSIILSITR